MYIFRNKKKIKQTAIEQMIHEYFNLSSTFFGT